MDGWMDEWVDRLIDGSMDGWMDGWMGGWVGGWTATSFYIVHILIPGKTIGVPSVDFFREFASMSLAGTFVVFFVLVIRQCAMGSISFNNRQSLTSIHREDKKPKGKPNERIGKATHVMAMSHSMAYWTYIVRPNIDLLHLPAALVPLFSLTIDIITTNVGYPIEISMCIHRTCFCLFIPCSPPVFC